VIKWNLIKPTQSAATNDWATLYCASPSVTVNISLQIYVRNYIVWHTWTACDVCEITLRSVEVNSTTRVFRLSPYVSTNRKPFPLLTSREVFQPLWLNSHCCPLPRIQLRSPCLSRMKYLIDMITLGYLLLCRTCNEVTSIPTAEVTLMEETALYN
jgi:hypothetical protein